MNKTEKTVYELAEPIIEELGCFIYDVEYVKEGVSRFLRIFADKDGGITVDECESISHKISDALDECDPISENYFLEVSSPGIERRLKLPWHFEMYMGAEVDLSLYKPEYGAKKFTGTLNGYSDDTITISEGDEEKSFNKKNVADVRLHFEF